MTKNKRIVLIALVLIFCLIATVALSACITSPRLLVNFDDSRKVTDGDSLDSLRPYLTVRYVDMFGRLRVVSDYTLTGTLSKGECTIYVEYEELTMSFNVIVEGSADDNLL